MISAAATRDAGTSSLKRSMLTLLPYWKTGRTWVTRNRDAGARHANSSTNGN
jgi:hypothetical protein